MLVTVRGEDRQRELNDVMEFDHVVYVHADGTISVPTPHLYAPELYEGELGSSDLPWRLIGRSNQQGGGRIMHQSEFIGGGLARLIMEEPGLYVSLVNTPLGEDPDTGEQYEADSWAVAHVPADDWPNAPRD